jgi:hypothetical protein
MRFVAHRAYLAAGCFTRATRTRVRPIVLEFSARYFGTRACTKFLGHLECADRVGKARAALQAETHDTQSTRLRGPITALGLRCFCRGWPAPIVIPGDDHRPIGAPRLRAFCTRDANPRCSLHQEILSMSARMDPLIQSFGEAVMPISDIFGSSPGTRRRHARTERAGDIMVEHVPCRHCRGLLLSNSVER